MASEGRTVILERAIQVADVLDLSAALVAAGLLALGYGDRSGTPRLLLALGFAFFVPGRAILANWPRLALWSEAAMAIVLSVAVLVLLSTVTLWAHAWHPMLLFYVEAWMSIGGLALAVARRHGTDASEPAAGQQGPASVDN